MLRRLPITTLLLSMLTGLAAAQDVKLYRADEAVNPHDVARILDQSSARRAAAPVKLRSIRLLDDAPQQAAAPSETSAGLAPHLAASLAMAEPRREAEPRYAAAAETVRPSAPARDAAESLALPVQFGFDSAEILPAARQQLDALAEGIRMLPATQGVVIEGHTDAAGSDLYNETLSQRRAYSVKRYLVAVHGIDPARLRAIGLGEYVPLRGRDANAPENRRVQFRGER